MTCASSRPRKLDGEDVSTSGDGRPQRDELARRDRESVSHMSFSDHKADNEPEPIAQAPTRDIRREDRGSQLAGLAREKIEANPFCPSSTILPPGVRSPI